MVEMASAEEGSSHAGDMTSPSQHQPIKKTLYDDYQPRMQKKCMRESSKNKPKTYNSGYSPVVTHLTTNPPVEGLTCGERTGPSELLRLWSYVEEICCSCAHIDDVLLR